MENFDQKPIFRCLICNGHFGTLEENEYGLWGHIIDPEEAEQAARAAEQNGMQSGSNTEMSPFYMAALHFQNVFGIFWIPLRTIILCMIIWMTLTMRTTMMIMMRRKKISSRRSWI